ncbi:hypothetical protein [Syntrophomonas wolfei]|jgi:hypothetical protein|uniref:Uncharacterized protein n=1 Tax=Syntrophomonas wolfei subsp. wolfei (strain DSM 2245B / Goettingen) TaxID=335541 RepID=Q0AVF4_SYNWW|nr:hypothetical protein [Syntrophomonas wolfei]ABI69300.1 hypothetical protein Swol_2005 [Syntrophomonas wolfei subsp. wolfei str. Goettingen G311]
MESNSSIIRKALGMPFVSAEITEAVEFLFARWEKERNGENPYLLMMTTPLKSYYIELVDEDTDKLSDLAINLTGGHQTGICQRGCFVYYPKDPNFDVFISAEYFGFVEYRQKVEMKIDVEYLQEKLGKFLQVCSSWYIHKGFDNDVLLSVMLTNAEEISLVNHSTEYSQPIPESLVLSYHRVPCNRLSDRNVKRRTINELKGAFNIS